MCPYYGAGLSEARFCFASCLCDKDINHCVQYVIGTFGSHWPTLLWKSGWHTVMRCVTDAGVCEERLYRVLRAAVQMGLFQAVLPTKKSPGVKFKNNKRSALLRDGHPNCLKNMVWLPASSTHHPPLGVDCSPSALHPQTCRCKCAHASFILNSSH